MNAELMWSDILDEEVAKSAARTRIDPRNWRTAGRKSKDKPEGENLDWWRADGARQLANYRKWLETTDWRVVTYDGVPAVELPFEVQIAGLTVRGFIDSVWALPSGEVVVVDAKTGSRTPDSMVQMSLYATALEVQGYPRPSLGSYWMTRKGGPTDPESLDRFNLHWWESIVRQFTTAVDNEIFLPNVGSHCISCGVKDSCYTVGGIDAYKFDPLHPNYLPSTQDTNNEKETA